MSETFPKKFVTGFLLLAIISGSIAFALGSRTSSQGEAVKTSARTTSSPSELPKTAFVEGLPSASTGAEATDESTSIDPNLNLTNQVANQVAKKFVDENPQDLGLDSTGQPSISLDGVDSILAKTIEDYRSVSSSIADWDLIVKSQPIKIKSVYQTSDLQTYTTRLNEIIQNAFLQPNAKIIVSEEDNLPSDTINLLKKPLDAALADLNNLEVPTPLLTLHKNLVALLVYQTQALALNEKIDADPLLVSLTIEKNDLQYQKRIEDFQNSLLKLANSSEFSFLKTDEKAPLIARLLQINSAHAIGWIVLDPANLAVAVRQLAQDIWRWIKTHARQIVKDRLVHRLVQQTIAWVQGGGKPQFIMDLKGFLQNTASIAAGDAIYAITPGLCRSFGPQITLYLQSAYLSSGPPIQCTLDQVVQNVKDFYADFSKGGWIAFSETILPSGNYYGQLFEATQVADAAVKAEEERRKSESETTGGFLDKKRCIERQNRVYEQCLRDNANVVANSNGIDVIPKSCSLYKNIPLDQQYCAQWQTVTPGIVVGQAVNNALGASVHQIVNAEDVTGLFSALFNSLLTKLVVAGEKGLLGVVFDKDSCTGKNGADLQKCIVEASCSEFKGKDYQDCVGGYQRVECTTTPADPAIIQNGSSTVSIPQSNYTCTVTPGGGGTGGGTTGGSCGPGCVCKPPVSQFLYLEDIARAQDSLEARARNGEQVGLDLNNVRQVINGPLYYDNVAAILQAQGYQTKFQVGPGEQYGCGTEIGVKKDNSRSENTQLASSACAVRFRIPNAICMPPEF